jgi:hypothetical protein
MAQFKPGYVLRLVNNEIRQKRASEEAFSRISRVMKFGNVSSSTAKEWLQRYKIGDRTLEEDNTIKPAQLFLLKVVATEYCRHQHLIYEQPCEIYNLCYLSDRYFMVHDDPSHKLASLYVYDIFHGQTQ